MKTENYLEPQRLTELQKRIWDIAKAHGWHEELKPVETWLGLVMTEVAEAVEADRNGVRADIERFNERMANLDGSKECFKEMYKRYIKGSIEEEFADVIIRLLDMAEEVHGDKMCWKGYYPYSTVFNDKISFIDNAWIFVKEVLNWGTMNISDSVSFMFDWAQDLGIDLWQHIEWKMKYNELRPYKHGGKKY
jgi:hypothetical protein